MNRLDKQRQWSQGTDWSACENSFRSSTSFRPQEEGQIPVQIAREKGAVVATLDHDSKRNAFDRELRTAITELLSTPPLSADRVLVLRAVGPVFSSGNDLNLIHSALRAGGGALARLHDEDLQLLERLAMFRLPIIAVVTGAVYGLAAEFVHGADWAIGTERAAFYWPEASHGIIPAGGVLSTAGRALLWKGQQEGLSASEAHRAGLLDEFVPVLDVDDVVARRTEWIGQLREGEYIAWAAAVRHVRRQPPGLWTRLPGLWLPAEGGV